jgi:hypothetical protein
VALREKFQFEVQSVTSDLIASVYENYGTENAQAIP